MRKRLLNLYNLLGKTMSKIKRYQELFKMTLQDFFVLFREYRMRKFHPYYLNELLSGKYVLFHPNRLMTIELGEENDNQTVAYIRLDKNWIPTAGFFALLHKTLCGLYFADRMGFLPVVANWDQCAYEEDEKINGTNNVFEYFFEPACEVTVESALNSRNVIILSEQNMDTVFFEYDSEWFHLSEKYIEKMGSIYKKYIRLNKEVKECMEYDIKKVLGNKKTLGIHFRGSDYRLNTNGHPMSLEIENYYPYIKEAIEKYNYEQIFIATDDLNALKKIEKLFANLVCYRDAMRTDGDVSVAFMENNRKQHKYQLGYEVLRDTYTLAQCDAFIGGHSQVAVGARFIKASYQKEYEYCQIIEKGINRNNKEWTKIFSETIEG